MTNLASKLGGVAPQMPVILPPSAAVVQAGASASLAGPGTNSPAQPAPAIAAVHANAPTPTPDQLTALVGHIQAKVAAFAPSLHFSVDQASGTPVVLVTDQTTKEVVWQFPSAAAIQISKALDLFQKGLLLNREA